jgi:transposase InsO family protein
MQQFNKFKNTKGFLTMYEYFSRMRDMDETAKHKVKVVTHYRMYGLKSAIHAFSVSKSQIYKWQALILRNPKRLSVLNKKSTAPHTTNKRIPEIGIEHAIIRLRKLYLRMGAKPLAILLRKEGYVSSAPTVGRILADVRKKNLLPIRAMPIYKKRKVKKERRATKQGYEIDTVVRYINGYKWYFVTAINIGTREVSVQVSLKHTSLQARHIIPTLENPICIQTDNGSEFMKDFHSFCLKKNIPHYFTYPRSPKMNAFVERFNRTLEYEFISLNRKLMVSKESLPSLQQALVEYVTFYNTIRPHSSLGYLSPVEYSKKQEVSYVVS